MSKISLYTSLFLSMIFSGYAVAKEEPRLEIIEQALSFELPVTSAEPSEQERRIDNEIRKKWGEADHGANLERTLRGLETFPQCFSLQEHLATLLGDYGEILDEPLQSKMIKQSKVIFDKLLQEVDKQPKDIYFSFKNEYYFRFGMYLEQYNVGIERVAYFWGTDKWKTTGAFRGYYSQGVGAAHYAKKLLIQGNETLAREYAQKAIVAWAQYFSYMNDYYNAYVHYALALGILGHKEEMMRALTRSAALVGRGLDYHEFKGVIDFIDAWESSRMNSGV